MSTLDPWVPERGLFVPDTDRLKHLMLREGVDPNLAQAFSEAMRNKLTDDQFHKREYIEELMDWANTHTHTTVSAVSILNEDTLDQFGRTNAGSTTWPIPVEAGVGDIIWYLILEERQVTASAVSSTNLPVLLDRGSVFDSYLSANINISLWKLVVEQSNLDDGSITFQDTSEGHMGTQYVTSGGVDAFYQFGTSPQDGSFEHPLDPYTINNVGANLYTFVGKKLLSSNTLYSIDDGSTLYEDPGTDDYFHIFKKESAESVYSPTVTLSNTSSDENLGSLYLEFFNE